MRLFLTYIVILGITLNAANSYAIHPNAHEWGDKDIQILKSLWIESLGPLPDSLSNEFADNPKAVSFGKKLFFDNKLSSNGKVACATCHIPDYNFTDALPVAHGIKDTTRRSMSLAGMAYSPWLFWDGRTDSLWAQALGPLENPLEHGISRAKCLFIIRDHYNYQYQELFGIVPKYSDKSISPNARPATDDPEIQALWDVIPEDKQLEINRLFVNIGKSIAAYVRTIQYGPSTFDHYVKALLKDETDTLKTIYTQDEAVGLKLFISKGQCIRCHNGPLLTNNDFHNVGVPVPSNLPSDPGRAPAIKMVRTNEFNCLGMYSDASPGDCNELKYMDTDEKKYEKAFKTPSLRNVAERPPYMHAGQFGSLSEVLKFYQQNSLQNIKQPEMNLEISHGTLSDEELRLIESFLKTLSGTISSAQ